MKKIIRSAQKWKSTLFAPKAGNVALANALLGVLGIQNAEMVEMTKFSEI